LNKRSRAAGYGGQTDASLARKEAVLLIYQLQRPTTASHLTMAPLLLVLLVVPLLPVEPLLIVPFLLMVPLLPLPPAEGVHGPPGRPTQLFG
jgi:hypothetical protein